tara:strand:+ start:38 stop:385 length:348 start_codon:yes stop_codon:yes gene_type:complete
MEQEVIGSTPSRLGMLVHPWYYYWSLLSIGVHMRKFSQSIVGKGVTFTKLCRVRDKRGKIDYERQEIDGIITENDGYLCTVRGWDGSIHTNVETSEIKTWAEADRNIEDELSCLV